jgi:hypothetical protein
MRMDGTSSHTATSSTAFTTDIVIAAVGTEPADEYAVDLHTRSGRTLREVGFMQLVRPLYDP